jgi:imidazolonepropionase-like amidohydrolase
MANIATPTNLIFNMTVMKLITYIFILLAVPAWAQLPAPATHFPAKTLLLGGTAHLGNGKVIENSAIAVANGRFTMVKSQMKTRIDVKEYDTVIYLDGKHIYPGFIVPNNTLGITEIDAVSASRDFRDVGAFNPNLRATVAFNTESKIVHTVRANGVLVAQVTPLGGYLSGASGVLALDGWNYQDAAIRTTDGLHLNWPNPVYHPETAEQKMDEITTFFGDALHYTKSEVTEVNIQFESMRALFKGTQTLYVHCHTATQIMQVIQFKKEFGIKNVTIVGGYDAGLLIQNLKENNISVILRKPHSLPMRNHDAVHYLDSLPVQLFKAGVLVCLDASGDMEAMNARNLPFQAGQLVDNGLTHEEAIQLISNNTAQILGIANNYGTISSGKSATFFVSSGDPLDMRTNAVILAWINGRPIDLNNTQTQLYHKYQAKYNVE